MTEGEGDGRDYALLFPYNGTGPAGGNPLEMDLNDWYEVSSSQCGVLLFGRPQADFLRPQARGHRLDIDGDGLGFAYGSRRWVSIHSSMMIEF